MALRGLESVGHHVREAARVAPGRPALWLGLRTAAATAVPLVVADRLDPSAASWAPLAGFLVALADKGGAYRSRAVIMAGVGLGGLAAVVLGTLIAGHGPLTAIAVALGLTVCALAQAWGPQLVTVGNAVAVQFLVAASLPGTTHVAFERGVGFAAGAGFALGLGLVVWPVRVYKPGRRAAAAVLRALAEHARGLAAEPPTDQASRDEHMGRHRAIRERIEVARVVLAATRRGRRAESGRGARLLALVQLCDQLFGILVGLEEALDAGCPPDARGVVADGLGALAADLGRLAEHVMIESPPADEPHGWSAPVPPGGDQVRHALAAHAIALVVRAHEDRAAAAAVIASLADDAEPLRAPVPEPEPRPSIRDVLVEALDRDGPIVRHAIRVAVVVSAAMAVARWLDLSHRYWVTLTAFLLMTPFGAATRVRALQRVAGTVVGGVLAALVPYAVDDPQIMLVVIVILAGLSASVIQLNYALYAALMTPTFVLLAEVHTTEVHLVGVRIANTLLAAGIVMIGTFLWPAQPAARFDDAVARAYDLAAAYAGTVVAAVTGGAPQPSPGVVAARRAVGIAINRAELSLDTLIAERAPSRVTEPRMTQLVFLRRFAGALGAFAGTRTVGGFAAHHVEITAFGASLEAGLHALAAHARGEQPLSPRPRLVRPASDPVVAARMGRADAALANLVDAALRAAPLAAAA